MHTHVVEDGVRFIPPARSDRGRTPIEKESLLEDLAFDKAEVAESVGKLEERLEEIDEKAAELKQRIREGKGDDALVGGLERRQAELEQLRARLVEMVEAAKREQEAEK